MKGSERPLDVTGAMGGYLCFRLDIQQPQDERMLIGSTSVRATMKVDENAGEAPHSTEIHLLYAEKSPSLNSSTLPH